MKNLISLVLLTFLTCSCSVFTMQSPPPQLPESPAANVYCTSDRSAPRLDMITSMTLAGGAAITALVAGGMNGLDKEAPQGGHSPTPYIAGSVALGSLALITAVSSIYGYHEANKCELMKEEQQDRNNH